MAHIERKFLKNVFYGVSLRFFEVTRSNKMENKNLSVAHMRYKAKHHYFTA